MTPTVMDPKTMMDLTFTATTCTYPPPPSHLPHIFFYKPGSVFGILETTFEMLVCCLPSVGLTEVNSSLVLSSLISLPLGFVSSE